VPVSYEVRWRPQALQLEDRWGGTWGNQATHVEMWIKQWDLMDLMALNGIWGKWDTVKQYTRRFCFGSISSAYHAVF